MRIELRVCNHCYGGEHGNQRKTAVTRDMVNCAEQVREYKDLLGAVDHVPRHGGLALVPVFPAVAVVTDP